MTKHLEEQFEAIDALSFTFLTKTDDRCKISSILNSMAAEWRTLLQQAFPHWPEINKEDEKKSTNLAPVISLATAAFVAQNSSEIGVSTKWIRVIFDLSDLRDFPSKLPRTALEYLKRFFTKDSRYIHRQLQLQAKDHLALVGPSKGFLTQHFLESEEIDEDIDHAVPDKPWKSFEFLLDILERTILSLPESVLLFELLPLLAPPLFQLLDDSQLEFYPYSCKLLRHVIGTLSIEHLSRNHFHSVLLEAAINKYWMWSIGNSNECDVSLNFQICLDLLECIETLLEKDVNASLIPSVQTNVVIPGEKSLVKKKSSETRIYPGMTWLSKVDLAWCTVLQGCLTLRDMKLKKIHLKFIKKWGRILGTNIERNFKALVKMISVLLNGPDCEFSLELLDFLREFLVICKFCIPKYEGEILICLVDFGNQLSRSEYQVVFETHYTALNSSLIETLDLLINILIDSGETDIVRNDLEALLEVEQLNLDWAQETIRKLYTF